MNPKPFNLMRSIYPIFFMVIALSCQDLSDDWKPLYNGQDLSGWVIKGKPEDLKRNYWLSYPDYIEANSLDFPDHDYVWLMTEGEYKDFELKFMFQAFGESPGNSGIQLRSRYNDLAYWLDGPQIDIHPPMPWRTGMMWDETKGNQRWIFPELNGKEWVDSSMAISNAPFYLANDPQNWNDMMIKAKGNQITAWLNGTLITDYMGEGTLDDSLHMAKNVGKVGHIAFQIHSGDALIIRFKDIYVRELR